MYTVLLCCSTRNELKIEGPSEDPSVHCSTFVSLYRKADSVGSICKQTCRIRVWSRKKHSSLQVSSLRHMKVGKILLHIMTYPRECSQIALCDQAGSNHQRDSQKQITPFRKQSKLVIPREAILGLGIPVFVPSQLWPSHGR